MAFEYEQVENDIIARLTAKMPVGYAVMQMPESEEGFNNGLEDTLILVCYSDSVFDPPSSTDIIQQYETLTVLCNLKSSRLRGDSSIQQAFGLLKKYLQGFKPGNVNKLFLDKIEFVQRDKENNFWEYNIAFKGKKLQLEVVEEEELPLLKNVTFNDQYEAPQFY